MSPGLSPIRVLTVDDHPLVREGIAGLIGVQPDMTLVGEAGVTAAMRSSNSARIVRT